MITYIKRKFCKKRELDLKKFFQGVVLTSQITLYAEIVAIIAASLRIYINDIWLNLGLLKQS